jgi:hypothetical protein
MEDKVLFDDNAVRISTLGDAPKVNVWRVVGKSHVRAELLKTTMTLRAGAVGVDQAADCSKVAGPEPSDSGADLCDSTNNFMARNAWIDSGHRAPLVTDLVEVGVAYTTEKDFDLNVVLARIAARNNCWSER